MGSPKNIQAGLTTRSEVALNLPLPTRGGALRAPQPSQAGVGYPTALQGVSPAEQGIGGALNPTGKRNPRGSDLGRGSEKEFKATLLLNLNQTQAKFSNQYKGLLFTFAGRLRGALRARKMQQSHGRISTQTFNSSINYSQKQILTK